MFVISLTYIKPLEEVDSLLEVSPTMTSPELAFLRK